MLDKLRAIYRSELVYPSFLSVFINPFYFIRKGLWDGIKRNAHYMKGVMMDFGCADSPYRKVFHVDRFIGMDVVESGHEHNNEKIDVYYDGTNIPFEDKYFDSVLSTEVFEHIFNIDEILCELNRVLKDGGHMLITVPFVWEEHEAPYDFGRYTTFGIEHLLNKSGFEVIVHEKNTNYVETVVQLWITYLCRSVLPKMRYIGPIVSTLVTCPLNILGITLSHILPKNYSLYHNSIIVARKQAIVNGDKN